MAFTVSHSEALAAVHARHLVLTAALKERSAREQRVARKLITLYARGFTLDDLAQVCHTFGTVPRNTSGLNSVWFLVAKATRVNRVQRASLIADVIAALGKEEQTA